MFPKVRDAMIGSMRKVRNIRVLSENRYVVICVKYACKNVLSSLDIDALEITILGGGPVDTRNGRIQAKCFVYIAHHLINRIWLLRRNEFHDLFARNLFISIEVEVDNGSDGLRVQRSSWNNSGESARRIPDSYSNSCRKIATIF